MANANSNLFAHFAAQFASRADEPLLVTNDETVYSYADIDRESARLARFLGELGASPGDRVSAQVEKSPAALSLYLACLRGGFVFHPLNPAYQAAELEYFFSNAEPSIVVCDSRNADAITPLANAAGVAHLLTLDGHGHGTLIDQSRSVPTAPLLVHCAENDMAALLYSSGTTGMPKGIVLTHGNLVSNARSLVRAWAFTERDRLLHALPIFHVHGLFVGIGCVLLSGASMRWLDAFDAASVIGYLPECTVMMGVPTYYTRLLAESGLTADATANMRVFISGSAPLLEDTFAEFESRTGHRILERYGMTETNMNTSNPLDGERKPGTVGLPLPGVEVRIVDGDGAEVAAGDVGNLQVRGANVFARYWRMPDKTAEDFTADGFFDTGDKGCVDDAGYVSIVGRAKDIVITGGLNVYPKEVELFIDNLDGVRESAIIGVPHADFGEAVVAVVVRDSGRAIEATDVIDRAKASLANFKVPKQVVFVDELPRNSMAKVQKNLLRDTYRDLFTRNPDPSG